MNPLGYSGFHVGVNNIETIMIIVQPDFLDRISIESECVASDQIELHPIINARDRLMESIAYSFLYEMQNEALGGRLYSEALATQFAIHLLRNYCTFPARLKKYSGGLSRHQLKTVIDYIKAHLEENMSLNDLARITQINSSNYFCSLFKQSMGIPPYQYVIQQRVARAKQLLKQDNLPLVEIALRCGFSSQSALSRTFHKLVGITPQKYRQQI